MTRTMRPIVQAQNLKVVAIQGHPVAPVMPGVGDTLVWDGTEWVPTPMPQARVGSNAPRAAGATLNLDTTVVGIQGTPVFPVASFLAPGDALLWTGVDWKNYPVAKSLTASDLGPYLPISAYNPDGGGGAFLPLTGGVLSGPGALTVGDVLTVAGAASAGGNSLVDMQGGSAVVQADGNGLLLQQLGDEYGLTSLLIANRDGLNGAMFTNAGLDLVDFAFQSSSGVTGTLRLDARAISTGQFLFMLSGNTLFTVDSAGNAQFFGTTTLAGDAVAPLEAVTLEQLNNAIANVPPPAPPLNGPIVGVTDGSNAAPGMVGEFVRIVSSNVIYNSGNNTDVGINSLNLTPGDWDVWGVASAILAEPSPPFDGIAAGVYALYWLRLTDTLGNSGIEEGNARVSLGPSLALNNGAQGLAVTLQTGILRINAAAADTVNLVWNVTRLAGPTNGQFILQSGSFIEARRAR